MLYLTFKEKEIYLPFFVENADIELTINTDSVDQSIVKGSVTHDIYKQYLDKANLIEKKMESAYTEYKSAMEKKDSVTMKKMETMSEDLDKEMKTMILDFAKTNSKSVVAPYLIMKNSYQFELPELTDVAKTFDSSLNSSAYYQNVNNRIEILKRVEIGQPAVDFTMNDSMGNPVALSSLKGKVLLVDFWASWCRPCRAENPNVVKAYQAYSKKGFDVLGVSFDKDRSKWIKATKDDNLTWTHVSDLEGWGNAAGKLYGVNSIPANVLLDANQVIVGKNLRGEELMSKLTELLGPPAVAKNNKSAKKSK
jgi:peroxiredoxin